MPPAARLTDMHTCPMVTGVVPHVGGPIIAPCAPTVLIGNLPAARVTDMLICVGPPDMIAKGSAGVFIGGLPAARIGDPTIHGGVIVVGWPTVIIGEIGSGPGGGGGMGAGSPGAAKPNGGKPAAASIPQTLPAKASDAPGKITLPSNVNKAMKDAYSNSFPGGKSQEHGGTLVSDDKGNIKVVNPGAGESGAFTPNRSVGSGEKVIGTYHTHPYDESEGGYKGVSFSSGDIDYAAYYHEPVLLDSGNKQFMIVPTKETPTIDKAELDKAWQESFDNATKNGKSFDAASSQATQDMAKKYDMAYYEGSDGELNRVVP